ncbi:MBL fold metallo-hydrolase, partial [Vibrio sp.]|uniref:MBL fold metallo-hydrolase n=1 Tax=Vibrio sp. TaxID=678 RepID=UPI003D0F4CFF
VSKPQPEGLRMNRILRIGLISIGVVLGLVILFVAVMYFSLQREVSKMKSVGTQEITENVYIIQNIAPAGGSVYMYLVKSGDHYLAIDAGAAPDLVQPEFDKLNIDPQDVAVVLLTHTDTDHIGALSLFNNAAIYISEAEEQMIDGRTARFMNSYNTLDYDYTIITDGQVTDLLGLKVEGVLTPGHTPGSMSFIIDDKYLFVGDTMGLDKGEAYTGSGLFALLIYYMDRDAQNESMQKLANLNGIEYLFTGHHGYTSDLATTFAGWNQ